MYHDDEILGAIFTWWVGHFISSTSTIHGASDLDSYFKNKQTKLFPASYICQPLMDSLPARPLPLYDACVKVLWSIFRTWPHARQFG